ncbi:MAG: ABC transporter permease subunit [Lachnospiraceae bacterium]|nr:ABC transporter permease subunit [Lachnospiraceae bacterium]
MKANPILKKELVLGARTIRFPIALMFYSGFLSLVALFTLSSVSNTYTYAYRGIDFDALTIIFLILAYLQMGIICIIIPVLTAGSIAGERERQTLDIMLTAPVRPFSIVMGKLLASLSQVFLFVISSLPAMSIAFLYGGIQWQYLMVFMAGIMSIAFFSGAIGIWCSSVYRKTIISVIMTMVIEVVFFVGTLAAVVLIYYLKMQQVMSTSGIFRVSKIDMGWYPLILLLNPAIGFVDVIMSSWSGIGAVESLLGPSFIGNIKVASGLKELLPYWPLMSLAVTLLMGFFFVRLASRRIDAVRRKEKHIRKKIRK